MTTGAGVNLIGGWFGTGPARGIALVFILTSIVGLIATVYALGSKYYRQLARRYMETPDETPNIDLDLPVKEGLVQ
jgi:DHA3 family multidrug efflux protein-like MFS transporter